MGFICWVLLGIDDGKMLGTIWTQELAVRLTGVQSFKKLEGEPSEERRRWKCESPCLGKERYAAAF
jgi:hypothetical protein